MRLTVPASTRTQTALFVLCGFALLVHLAVALVLFTHKPESISTTPDPLDYRLGALNILDHHEFTFAPPAYHATQLLRTPGYAFVLAGTYLLDHRTGFLMVILQTVTLIGMGILLFVLLRRFRVPERISLLVTAAYLFEPLQWLYTLHTMTETFSSAIILALVVAACVGKGISTALRAALFGLGLAALLYLKPSATMWIPFLLLLILCAEGVWQKRILRAAFAALICVLALMPWIVRNHSLTGHYVMSSSGPFNLLLFAGTPDTVPSAYWNVVTTATYNDHTNQVWYAYTTDAYPMLLATQHTILANANYMQLAIKQIAYAPAVWFGFVHTQNDESYGHSYSLLADLAVGHHAGLDRIIDLLDPIFWAILLLLTIFGSFLLLSDVWARWRYLPLLAMLVGTVFINFAAAWARMLLPMYPVIFLASGSALAYGVKHIQGLRTARRTI